MAVDVTAAQLERFRKILAKYPPQAGLPSQDAWRGMSDDDVWVKVMSQVVVVGRADPAKRLHEKAIRDRIAWEKVSRLEPPAAAQAIWSVLRDIGARYAGQDSKLCRKTGALVKNLVFLKKYAGGPKGFIRDVATLKGDSHH